MMKFCIGASTNRDEPPAKRKKKRDIVEVSEEYCIRMLKEKKFSTVEYNGRAPFWRIYRLVLTEEKKQTNWAQCRCGKMDVYMPENGTKKLSGHYSKCNVLVNNGTLEKYVTKEKQISKEEKAALSHAAADFCVADMRPFYAIEGAGLLKLLASVSLLSAKYGVLTENHLRSFLPCPNTVSGHKYILTVREVMFYFEFPESM